MCITRLLHIVSHPPYIENYMQVGDPKSERLITMTSLPVANNIQYIHIVKHFLCHHFLHTLYSHCIYKNTLSFIHWVKAW